MRCITRRRLLNRAVRGATLALGAAWLPDFARAAEAAGLPANAADTLEQLAYDIFPHSGVLRDVYRRVVEQVLAQVKSSDATRALVSEGLADLDRRAGGSPWRELAVRERTRVLREIEDGAFFRFMRGAAAAVYVDPEIWQRIGYGGSSIEHGGYLERGFDDIDWLPNS